MKRKDLFPPMQHEPPVDLSPHFFTLGDLQEPLDWRELFGNDKPVEIDIGCGRGKFVVEAGEANPETNYLGIEIDYREGRHGAKRLKRRGLSNVRILGGDVRIALDRFIRPESVAHAHVYFPDPWWKRKHRRRRVFTDQLVVQMAHVLQPRGYVTSWTDVEEYFEIIAALMDHSPLFESLTPPEEKEAEHDLDYRTSYERKRRKAGETIHRGFWRLRD